MLDAFNKWVILNWEINGTSLHSCWGLGSKYLCLLFNSDVVVRNVLQYGTWNMVGLLSYVQSWRFDFNPDDISQAHYPLRIEFLGPHANLRPFVDLFAKRFGKVLIPNDDHNSFSPNAIVCVEVDLKHKPSLFISILLLMKSAN
jgi:hypothetical protein